MPAKHFRPSLFTDLEMKDLKLIPILTTGIATEKAHITSTEEDCQMQ
jgi:hypothetical protein